MRSVCSFSFGSAVLVLGLVSAVCAEAQKKLPVPGNAEQAKALQLLKEVYGDESEKARTAEQKSALAKKLLENGAQPQDSPAIKFGLLKVANQLAIQAADCSTALETIDAMANDFQIDGFDLKAYALDSISRIARSAEQHQQIAEEALKLADAAIGEDNYAVADRLAKLAVDEVRKNRNKDLLAVAQAKLAAASQAAEEHEKFKSAKASLETKPDDVAANLAVGKYLCFYKHDWEKGLPKLALGQDEELRSIATTELNGATSSAAQASLGDAWWSLGDKRDGSAKKQLESRAAFWYQKALPELEGLKKMRVEKRLSELDDAGRPEQRPQRQALSPVYLSDLEAVKVIVWGDSGLRTDDACGGKASPRNLFGHPPKGQTSSHIEYDIAKFSKQLKVLGGAVGTSDNNRVDAALTFAIFGDGKLLWKSTSINKSGTMQSFSVNVAQVKTLELVVDASAAVGARHGNWIEPALRTTAARGRK